MTLFSLVRHGAYGLLDRALGGRVDHPLDAEGLAQAGRLAEALGRRPIAAIVSSPVRRAQQTASAIALRLRLAVSIDADFSEIDFAGWTGATFDSLRSDPAWQAWNRHRGSARVPGGETMLAVQARALAGLARLAERWPGSELVVVSHADVIRSVLVHALGMPLDDLLHIEIAAASTSRLQWPAMQVLAVNQPA